jgi:hypothetical protein
VAAVQVRVRERKRGRRRENDRHRRGHREVPDRGDGVRRRVYRRELMRDSSAAAAPKVGVSCRTHLRPRKSSERNPES